MLRLERVSVTASFHSYIVSESEISGKLSRLLTQNWKFQKYMSSFISQPLDLVFIESDRDKRLLMYDLGRALVNKLLLRVSVWQKVTFKM